jgi:hypothetical protein
MRQTGTARSRFTIAVRSCGALLLGLACATAAAADDSQRSRIEASLGLGAASLVEGSATQTTLVVTSPFRQRWEAGAEFSYLYASPRESGRVLQLVLVRRYGTASSRVRPCWLLGAGPYFGSGHWCGDVGVTATIGTGVQLFVAKNLFLAPEVRIGYVPTARLALAVGYSGGSRR